MESVLEHLCNLPIGKTRVRNTNIICTLGPASHSVEEIRKLIKGGMNIARLNFSHGDHKYHEKTIVNVRKAVKQLNDEMLGSEEPKVPWVVAIALDTKGPEIRTGIIENDADVVLKTGESIRVSTEVQYSKNVTAKNLYVDYKNITKILSLGSLIYIDDGFICLKVIKFEGDEIICRIENGGLLSSRKGVNLPGAKVDLPAVSPRDKDDLKFGVEMGVDIIFASFIRNAQGIKEIREVLGAKGRNIKIVAKIENQEGLDNLDEIIKEADGSMVARGDLGIEIPCEKIGVTQKKIIAKCNVAGKPVICATQMLESMTNKPRPTMAEASDVANAVLDGADCVMMSGETAKGKFPFEALQVMHNVCRETEATLNHRRFLEEIQRLTPMATDDANMTAFATVSAAINFRAAAILVLTTTGRSAALLSKYRPPCPIICVTRDVCVARQLQLYRGTFPVQYGEVRDEDGQQDEHNRVEFGIRSGTQRGLLHTGDVILVCTGWSQESGKSNNVRFVTVE